jgi:hypothetical protein
MGFSAWIYLFFPLCGLTTSWRILCCKPYMKGNMRYVLPITIFQFGHSKNLEILMVHWLSYNNHNMFMRLIGTIHNFLEFDVGGSTLKKCWWRCLWHRHFLRHKWCCSDQLSLILFWNQMKSFLHRGLFLPHRLSTTSFHFLSILHIEWASNESCFKWTYHRTQWTYE